MTLPKVEITDEMVERACRATLWVGDDTERRKLMRHALEAALHPSPEIAVSSEMCRVGWAAGMSVAGHQFGTETHDAMVRIYRAMEAQRRKEIQKTEFRGLHGHWREGEKRPGACLYTHRREGDPK